MSFINWGEETPEQKAARARYEEEQMLFEQAVRFARTTGAMAGVGSGILPDQPTITTIFGTYTNNGQPYISFGFFNPTNELVEITIDWGDDTKEKYSLTNEWIYPEHYYDTHGEYSASFKSKQFDVLTDVYFANNNISSLTGLHLLSNVTSLDLSGNSFIEFGEDFTWPSSLMYLTLYSAWALTSFNPVNPLPETLNSLTITGSQLTEFNPLNSSFTSLETLFLAYNELTSFSPEMPMPELRSINLESNNIHVFSGNLSLLPELWGINLKWNQMTHFNPSQPLPSKLTSLDLSENLLSTFNPGHALPNSLRYLMLSSNRLTSFSPSQAMPTTLESLDLRQNQITSFTPAFQLSGSLRVLKVSSNGISNVNQIFASVQNGLEELDLSQNPIVSFSPTINFPNTLRVLNLGNSGLTTFNPANSLPSSLRVLALNGNNLTSFTTQLPNLEEFSLHYNPNLTTLEIGSSLGNYLNNFAASYAKLSQATINNILIRLSQVTTGGPGARFITLYGQNPPAPPSGAGLTAKTILQSRSFNVYTD